MCITAPARVVTVDGDVATVELDGRRRVASLAVLPDVVAGDWVIVGAGTVIRRLEPADAQDLVERIATARKAAALRAPGPPRPSSTSASAVATEGEPR